jgi:hypothetical protein
MNFGNDDAFADCPPDLLAAHDRSSNHRAEVMGSISCGCFCCCQTFAPTEITEWTDDDKDGQGQTAICPRCGVDSVIGSKSGIDISQDFLSRMSDYWF